MQANSGQASAAAVGVVTYPSTLPYGRRPSLKQQGCWVRGRNSDNTLLREVLNWEPEISLEEGIARTYNWIEEQVNEKLAQSENAGDELAHSKVIW